MTQETPYALTYGTEVVILAEIGVPTPWVLHYKKDGNDNELRLSLDLVEERRELAGIQEVRHKQKVKQYYDKWVKQVQFQKGELVLRKSETSPVAPTGKLQPTWEGPYRVDAYCGPRTYKLAYSDAFPLACTWHVSNLRKYYS